MPDPSTTRRAVLLDRDGTINCDVGYTHRVKDLQLLPNAAAGLARMAALGYRLIVTTNQSGIARGYFQEADMHAFNRALCAQLQDQGITIHGIYFCPFHPIEGTGDYRRESPLRKPGDGMMRLAAAEHDLRLTESYVVGDKNSDILAGQRAGCRTILVRTGAAGSDAEVLRTPPDFVAADLLEAAAYIERNLPTGDNQRTATGDRPQRPSAPSR